MILVDDRIGSRELVDQGLLPPSIAVLSRLEYGDFCFDGNSDGNTVLIGIERKTVGDLCSCIADHRFVGHQLPGLLDNYQVVYLLVEGIMAVSPDGRLIHRNGKKWYEAEAGVMGFTYQQVVNYMNTIAIQSGVRLLSTIDLLTTAMTVKALHSWWQKDWDKHQSLAGVHSKRSQNGSTLFRMLLQLEGIGPKLARVAAKHFGSLINVAVSDLSEWKKLDGVGDKLGNKIVKQLRQEEQ